MNVTYVCNEVESGIYFVPTPFLVDGNIEKTCSHKKLHRKKKLQYNYNIGDRSSRWTQILTSFDSIMPPSGCVLGKHGAVFLPAEMLEHSTIHALFYH